MTDKTEEDRVRLAESDLVSIDRLLNSKDFVGYYLRRLEEKRDIIAREVLENDMLTPEQRESKRMLYNELGHIIDMPQNDKQAIRAGFKGP